MSFESFGNILVSIIGAFFVLVSALMSARFFSLRYFIPGSGTPKQCKVYQESINGSSKWKLNILVSYSHNGADFLGSPCFFQYPPFRSSSSLEKYSQKFMAKEILQIFINPKNPSEYSFTKTPNTSFALACVLFFVIGLSIMVMPWV
jgi:hypothetical protein